MNLNYYRFFFRQSEKTAGVEVSQCDGSATAMDKTKELLGASRFAQMEVWQGTCKVGVEERSSD